MRRREFPVRTDAKQVAAFAAVLPSAGAKSRPGPTVPLIFPIAWLGTQPVRETFPELLVSSDFVVLHETQSFEVRAELQLNADYLLQVTVEDPAPQRLILSCRVTDRGGTALMDLRATFRILGRDVVRDFLGSASPPPIEPAGTAAADFSATHYVDRARILAYVSAVSDDNPVHRDDAAARAIGLTGLLVPGMLVLSQIEAAVATTYPDARVVRLAGRFLAPLVAPATITIRQRTIRTMSLPGGSQVILRLHAGSDATPLACLADVVLLRSDGVVA